MRAIERHWKVPAPRNWGSRCSAVLPSLVDPVCHKSVPKGPGTAGSREAGFLCWPALSFYGPRKTLGLAGQWPKGTQSGSGWLYGSLRWPAWCFSWSAASSNSQSIEKTGGKKYNRVLVVEILKSIRFKKRLHGQELIIFQLLFIIPLTFPSVLLSKNYQYIMVNSPLKNTLKALKRFEEQLVGSALFQISFWVPKANHGQVIQGACSQKRIGFFF